MGIRSCENCYFYDDCSPKHWSCGFFTPLEEIELTDKDIEKIIRAGRAEYRKRYWETLEEEDRLQDYFG